MSKSARREVIGLTMRMTAPIVPGKSGAMIGGMGMKYGSVAAMP